MTSDRQWLAGRLDADLTDPALTRAEIRAACALAAELGVHGVVVDPTHVGAAPEDLVTSVVVGYPTGRHHSLVKAAEARLAVQYGASEVDVVLDIAAVKAADDNALLAEMVAIREALASPVTLKFIVESAVVDDVALEVATHAARAAGADFIKTSTGFHPAGGATVEAVRVLASAAQGQIGVKASGGIRTWEQAVAMVEAGATRIGTSNARAILEGAPA